MAEKIEIIQNILNSVFNFQRNSVIQDEIRRTNRPLDELTKKNRAADVPNL